jgi:GntP family gluconate:H+ symporter
LPLNPIVWAASAVAGIVILVSILKVHPFVALILGSLGLGLCAGLSPDKAIAVFQKGAGETLGGVGLVVALGAMLGKLLTDSGGAESLVSAMLQRTGVRYLPWAMAGAAMLLGIPMFFEVGLVLLMPMILVTARRAGGSPLRVGVPALAGLSVLHGLLAPHPGPLLAIAALQADLATTLLAGLVVALPTVVVAGPLFGSWIGRHVNPPLPALTPLAPVLSAEPGQPRSAPRVSVVLATLLLPVALMLARAVGALVAHGKAAAVLAFAGHPTVAMLAGVLVAMLTLGSSRSAWPSAGPRGLSARLGESFAPVAPILVILGAGGGFKQTLVESGVGDAISRAAQTSHVSPLLLAWLIAVAIRVATGSATLATITASGILAPLVATMPGVSRPLLVLAIGSGSLFFSHVNDAGFWLVKEYFGMTIGETLKSWSVMETLISVVAMACVLALSFVA